MNKIKHLFFALVSVLIVSVLGIGVFSIGIDTLLGKTVLLSLATVSPQSMIGLYTSSKSNGETAEPFGTDTEYNGHLQISLPSETEFVTATVEQQKMGNIIKKSLSPYNANTKFGAVYINNKCGESIDIESDLQNPLDYTVTKSPEPQILIYHTHSTEAFMTSESEYYTNTDEPRSIDCEKNIVKIGEILANELESCGFKVVHSKIIHDSPAFSGSYDRSANTVKEILEKYPSIKIAIDVHRDSISSGESDKVAPVVTVDGKEAAQVMLVMGSQTGSVKDYPDWRKNLRLATKLQYTFESRYPQFSRAMLLKTSRYNQHLTTGSILIEIGSDANTFSQAEYSAKLVGRSLVALLESQ